jgi:hypothetical protein
VTLLEVISFCKSHVQASTEVREHEFVIIYYLQIKTGHWKCTRIKENSHYNEKIKVILVNIEKFRKKIGYT